MEGTGEALDVLSAVECQPVAVDKVGCITQGDKRVVRGTGESQRARRDKGRVEEEECVRPRWFAMWARERFQGQRPCVQSPVVDRCRWSLDVGDRAQRTFSLPPPGFRLGPRPCGRYKGLPRSKIGASGSGLKRGSGVESPKGRNHL